MLGIRRPASRIETLELAWRLFPMVGAGAFAAQSAVGGGLFIDDNSGEVSAGSFVSSGALATINQNSEAYVFGASAGYGVGDDLTPNAGPSIPI